MEKIIFTVIIFTSACCLSKKHVFVENSFDWGEARTYCQNHHTDISPLTNELEQNLFRNSFDDDKRGWIGIYWDQDIRRWKWSGGDNVTYDNNLNLPANTDPNNLQHIAENVFWTKDNWQYKTGTSKEHFFCLNLMVVQEEKTWEEALKYCTRNQGNLSSLLSETENLLATNEIQQTSITEPVWTGLRYLGDEWLWVNGDPLRYWKNKLGGEEDLDQCPLQRRCGALTKKGQWEKWDCQKKLSFICG